jgi:phosphate transport system permease protein
MIRRAKRRDKIARWGITAGGLVVIASVAAILLLIASVVVPLFGSPRIAELANVEPSRKDILALGVDLVELGSRPEDDSLTGYLLSRDGDFTFLDFSETISLLPQGEGPGVRALGVERAKYPGNANDQNQKILALERHAGSRFTLLWSDGSISLVEPELTPQFDELGHRSVKHSLRELASIPADGKEIPLKALLRKTEDGSPVCVKLLPNNRLAVSRQITVPGESILDEAKTETKQIAIEEGIPGTIASLAMDSAGKMLYAGTDNGCVAIWEFGGDGQIARHDVIPAFRDQRKITALAMVLGDISLAVGDERGEVSVWTEVREDSAEDGKQSRKLKLVHRLSSHSSPVCDLIASRRDKSLLSLGEEGAANLDFVTTGGELLKVSETAKILQLGYAPRGNALIALGDDARLRVWKILCPHPEIDFGALFGKIQYEGYSEPVYKWQTTADQGAGEEPKFSLVPIIFGTLKSTFYAMFFALPLALAGAVYVSYFTTPGFKNSIKPIVEIMAAVPSVVIGFLILLWLAPLMSQWLLAFFLAFATIPICLLIFLGLWQTVRGFDWAKRVEHGYEFLALTPVLIVGGLLAYTLAGPVEHFFFHGDVKQWLFDTLNQRYDNLNSLVVAFGLGFAVIPIIFSISEDSLSNIPYNLTAASLALGASRWQTLWRVILPSASPGIFAAVMIGFGRAVGETMIVFMAAGNTPLLDFSPFNGFRTLSANIAQEMPEAAVGGTLYRVLFLCALLLFILTFALNTAAEVVRQRLRKKYGKY